MPDKAGLLQVDSGSAEPETPASNQPAKSTPSADDAAMLETDDEDLRMALQMSMVSVLLASYPAHCSRTSSCTCSCTHIDIETFTMRLAVAPKVLPRMPSPLSLRCLSGFSCVLPLHAGLSSPQGYTGKQVSKAAAREGWQTCCRTADE